MGRNFFAIGMMIKIFTKVPGKNGTKTAKIAFWKDESLIRIKWKIPKEKITAKAKTVPTLYKIHSDKLPVFRDNTYFSVMVFWIFVQIIAKNPATSAAAKYPTKNPPVNPCKITWTPAFPVKTGNPIEPSTKKTRTAKLP